MWEGLKNIKGEVWNINISCQTTHVPGRFVLIGGWLCSCVFVTLQTDHVILKSHCVYMHMGALRGLGCLLTIINWFFSYMCLMNKYHFQVECKQSDSEWITFISLSYLFTWCHSKWCWIFWESINFMCSLCVWILRWYLNTAAVVHVLECTGTDVLNFSLAKYLNTSW